MDARQLLLLVLQVSIVSTVFGFGLKATKDDLLYLVHRPGLLVRSLLAVFVIVPIAAIALAQIFDFRHTAEVALIALAISPLPPLLPQREMKAGGNHGYGLGLMATLALASIVTVPLWGEILERLLARPFAASPAAIARVVLIAALLPLVAGTTMRALLPSVADRIEKPVSMIGKILLPLAVVALLAATWRQMWAAAGEGAIVAMVLFVLIALLVGHLLGAPDPDRSVVLAISSACRHPAIALSIASANFAEEHLGGTILLYVIVNIVVGMIYIVWQRNRVGRAVLVV